MHPGSIRNNIANLTVLGLVESVTGPGGGYTPTEDGYASVGIEQGIKTAPVLKWSGIKDMGVCEATIDFLTNEVMVKVIGKLECINPGDKLTIVSKKFEIIGTVLSKNEDLRQIVMDGDIITQNN